MKNNQKTSSALSGTEEVMYFELIRYFGTGDGKRTGTDMAADT